MAKSSANITKVSTHSFKHNDRTEEKEADTIYNQFSFKNECDKNARESLKEFNKLYNKSINKVKGKIRRAKRENTLIEVEVNTKPETNLEDLKKIQKYIENEFGFTGIQIANHKDEGHFENGKFFPNLHAHLNFFTLNKETGRQLFRREYISKWKLAKLQDQVAKILGMERTKSSVYTKEEIDLIKKELKPKSDYKNNKEYKKAWDNVAKKLNIYREKPRKRLEHREYKIFIQNQKINEKEKKYENIDDKEKIEIAKKIIEKSKEKNFLGKEKIDEKKLMKNIAENLVDRSDEKLKSEFSKLSKILDTTQSSNKFFRERMESLEDENNQLKEKLEKINEKSEKKFEKKESKKSIEDLELLRRKILSEKELKEKKEFYEKSKKNFEKLDKLLNKEDILKELKKESKKKSKGKYLER